jgi:hypothetical protein
MADVAVGQRYRLLRKIGNDTNEDGSQGDPLHVGMVATVLAFSPANELGASHHDGDCWVLAFEVRGAALDETDPANPVPFMVQTARNYAFSAAELDDPTLFEPADTSPAQSAVPTEVS